MADRQTPAAAAAGGVQWRARVASLLEIAGAVATVGAMILVVEICRELLTADPDTGRLEGLVLTAVATAVLALAVQITGRTLSRQAAQLSQELFHGGVAARLRARPAARSLHAAWRAQSATLGGDIASAGVMVGRAGSELVSALLVFVLSIGYLFWVDWRMALVTLLPILLGFVTFGVISARFFKEMKDEYVASIGAVDAVRPTIGLDARINRAGARARTAAVTRTSARRLSEATDGFSDFFQVRIGALLGGRAIAEIAFSPLTVLVFVLCGGALMVRDGSLAPGDLVPFLVVGAGLAAPLLASTYSMEEVGEGKKATARLTAFAAGVPAPAEGDQPAAEGEQPATDPAEQDAPVDAPADGLGLELPERGVVTVIAPTPEGAGRVADWLKAETPPERFAAVEAEPAVVIGPVGAYITADRPGGTAQDAERAARTAGVHDTVAAFPRGYASDVGAEVSLSYPELQRLALARVVAGGGHEVVLLDQRAFGGDTGVLRAAVDELRERAAVVVLSPGPSAVTDGRLMVVEDGRVVESGTHEQLLREGGRYAAMLDGRPDIPQAVPAASRTATSQEGSR
ncbi:ABC transporter ATP-binding protein [Streptomyces sp. ME19-01-6]|uniref:ABC transporter ATP-binding protein n=1 Tax=Streptomyces sp. ME19-01-6 TaxID=3028686 RepID=UPI0029B490E8|nr:ABC transporter ATP-binding protein [Streptomyces sp. ME19-01-6]MDX3228189.1 ABC transporter ATP-binding protein [Streptomyces sp. ME19-01-6]